MKCLVWDTETTGLTKHPDAKMSVQPRMIEFGGVIITEDGEPIDELSLLIDPRERLEEVITKITGLTDEDLSGKPVFQEVLGTLSDFFSKADIMTAHNLPFDRTILELELDRAMVVEFPWPRLQFCSVQEYAEIWGRRPKLKELYEDVLGKPLAQTHRALDDAKALAEIIVEGGLIENFIAMEGNQ